MNCVDFDITYIDSAKIDKKRNEPCFACVRRGPDYRDGAFKNVKSVDFFVKVKVKDKEIVKFYIDFIKELFDGRYETLIEFEPGKKLTVSVECEEITYERFLLYVTAYRYVEEFSSIVEDFHKAAKDLVSTEEKFNAFLKVHYDHCVKGMGGNLWGHGLICYGSGYGSTKSEANYISFKDFRKKILEAKNPASVHWFFTK